MGSPMASDAFAGRSVLVVGAATGIGRATALAFAAAGADLVVADVAAEALDETWELCRKEGAQAERVVVDIRDAAAVEAAVALAVASFGRLDCAANVAGREAPNIVDTASITEADWDATIELNLRGTWNCMRHELRQFDVQGQGGSIVNMSSIAGLVGLPGSAAYAAAKAGIIQLTRTAALEYAERRIRVNAVCPGTIDTPMMARHQARHPNRNPAIAAALQPMNRIGQPAEIADAVVWLSSDGASFCTGQALAVDGGYTVR
ncbi:MAG: SDR family oxidoreductase [Microbacteriaceae bacterium]